MISPFGMWLWASNHKNLWKVLAAPYTPVEDVFLFLFLFLFLFFLVGGYSFSMEWLILLINIPQADLCGIFNKIMYTGCVCVVQINIPVHLIHILLKTC